MPYDERNGPRGGHGKGSFVTTRWSVVLAAGQPSPESGEALATLCKLYWYPLYAFVRRRGHNPEEAGDLTQGFFTRLIDKNVVEAADRDRGKFRSYLLAALKCFLSNERDRARALKRGGGCETISIDAETAEGRYCLEVANHLTPEKLFERQWVLTLLDLVVTELGREFEREGKARVFERLKEFLGGVPTPTAYSEAAAELGMPESAVRVAVHRLRRRYRQLVRKQVADTVATPGEVDDEIRQLFAAVSD